jgi:hypothetical protein
MCPPLLSNSIVVADFRGLFSPDVFSQFFYPTIAHHLKCKSNWSYDGNRSMKLKQYPTYCHIPNDKTHGSLPFTKCNSSSIFMHVIKHILTNHVQKTQKTRGNCNTSDYATDPIPVAFPKRVSAYQQRPHIGYHQQKKQYCAGLKGPSSRLEHGLVFDFWRPPPCHL